jgi:Tol biopolymer transport system component
VLVAACQPTTPPSASTSTAAAVTSAPTSTAGAAPAPTAADTPAGAALATATAAPRPSATSTPSAPSPTGAAAAASRNLFVYTAFDGSLSLHDPTTREVRVLLKASNKEFFDGPSFSLDGSRIVYVYTNFDNAGKLSSEIRSVRVDGGDVRTLFKAPNLGPALFFGYPRYTPDGVSITFSVITDGSTPRENLFQVVRGPAAGGNWTVMLDNGYEPNFTLDNKKVTFLRVDPRTFYTSFWIANTNGTGAQQLIAEDIFMEVAGPHFSPDGQWIAFAASGPPSKKLPAAELPMALNHPASGGADRDDCALRLLFVCLATRAHANGLPWELWLVSPDGKHFKQLTDLSLDSPWPAFSRDGRYVGFMTFDGTYAVDRQTNKVSKLSGEGGHGVIDWYQK